MPSRQIGVVHSVVQQHAEEAASLRNIRTRLRGAAQVGLRELARHDARIEAHLDGLLLAGESGANMCNALLGSAGVGEVFVATVMAIEHANTARMEALLGLAQAAPSARLGLFSGFGWVSSQFLQGTVAKLLAAENTWRRQLGIASCVMHRVDPGLALDGAVHDADVALRSMGLRAAGECGRQDLLATCVAALTDKDAGCRSAAARSAALLGGRSNAVEVLREVALTPDVARRNALSCVLKILNAGDSTQMLKHIARDGANIRLLIYGAGIAGDPFYVPWLLRQMEAPPLTRLAGEAFSMMTGVDLGKAQLDRERPEFIEFGPNDDADDDNVAMDEDDGLPWPDAVKLQAWWDANHQRFEPGLRYFMGERVTVEHCRKVLRDGFQRQRVAAAEYLCLLTPGTRLFPTSAPAWRQQRWLRQMG